MLDYKLIEAFAKVIGEGGFEKAAKCLHITQSAVSQRIRSLEEQVGQILLTRTTPPSATHTGLKLLKHYHQVELLERRLSSETGQQQTGVFIPLAIGVNADSLATWILPALEPFLAENKVLLNIRVDDQEETCRFLKNGEVAGVISTHDKPVQGCRMDYVGCMQYRLSATPEFKEKWFSSGLEKRSVEMAPAVIFNKKDQLHYRALKNVLGSVPQDIPANYIPSAEKFVEFIVSGQAYGMVPELQCRRLFNSGSLLDLVPEHGILVHLYWHCWNLKSTLLERLSRTLIQAGGKYF